MSGSNAAARAGAALGALTVAALPAGVAAAWLAHGVGLLRAMEVAVPTAFVLGLVTVSVVRRARYRVDRSVQRPGEHVVRAASILAWLGLYAAATGAIALGFYGLLVVRG
jgi:hypothetical protein